MRVLLSRAKGQLSFNITAGRVPLFPRVTFLQIKGAWLLKEWLWCRAIENVISDVLQHQKKILMGDRENKFQKIQISQNEILRMKFYAFFLNSCEIRNFIFRATNN